VVQKHSRVASNGHVQSAWQPYMRPISKRTRRLALRKSNLMARKAGSMSRPLSNKPNQTQRQSLRPVSCDSGTVGDENLICCERRNALVGYR
jgi:hypothetical protein